MRIRGWSIDGFGIFRDFRITDLPEGLTVVYGPNEAGKSTLLAFLRGILFGFANGAGQLLNAPRAGGRLFVSGPDGEYTIERNGMAGGFPSVIQPDGITGGAEDLRRLLGGVDDVLFRSVFAFSLAELHSFESLNREQIRDRLFSATIAGAGRSARAIIDTLGAEGAKLLAERGAARINDLVGDLNGLRPRLDAARRAAGGYAGLLAAARMSAAEVDRLRRALADRRAARTRDEALIQLWPTWQELVQARQSLQALEPVDEFPRDAEVQLRVLRGQLAAAEATLGALRQEHRQAEQRRADVRGDEVIAGLGAEVEKLHDELVFYRHQLTSLAAARMRRQEQENVLAERLHLVGVGWDTARLAAFDFSASKRDAVRAWGERLRSPDEREKEVQRGLEAAVERRTAIQREHDQIAARLSQVVLAEKDTLDEQRRALWRVRANLEEMKVAQSQGEARAQTAQDRERAVRALEAETSPRPPRWLSSALWVVVAASFSAAFWRSAVGDFFATAALGGTAVVCMIAEYALRGLDRWTRAREHQRHAMLRVLRGEMEEARRGRDVDWHSAAQLREYIARDSAALGLPRLPSFRSIEERDVELARQLALLSRSEGAQARLNELNLQLRDVEQEQRRLAAELSEARDIARGVRREWVEWKIAAGLPAELPPDQVLDHLASIGELRGILAARDEAQEQARQLEAAVATWEGRARAVLAQAGLAGEWSGDALVDQLMELRRRAMRDEVQRVERAGLDGEMQERVRQLAAAEAQVRRYQAEMEQLLSASGAAGEGEFERRRQVYGERQALRRMVDECERVLAARIGPGAEGEAIRAELVTGGIEEWSRRVAGAEGDIEALEQQLVKAVEGQYEAKQSCRTLEQSAEVASLEIEREGLIAELAAAVREWRLLMAARGLIEETLREFERTRQPAVLVEASKAFSNVTGGRYEKVVQDESGQSLVVVDRAGQRKQVTDELSRGTAEQLYVSIRLGLAVDFARRSVSLPMVMDDVLVNFDPMRARAMAAELGRFARDHQVLFFTCHPSTCEMLTESGNAARIVEI